MYKTTSNNESFVYITNYNFLNTLKDFTIYFWQYQTVPRYGYCGHILTFDISGGYTAFSLAYNQYVYGSGNFSTGLTIDSSIWTFHEYTFKQSGSNYIITVFYQGIKKYTGIVESKYIKQSKTIFGNWDYAPNYKQNGFYGYVYDLSIYDDIIHTDNYTDFPIKEMTYINNYKLYQNNQDMYGL